MGDVMYGQRSEIRSRKETVGRDVLRNEGARPRKVAPWPWRTTPWNWSEARKQYEAKRLQKSQVK